MKLFFIFLAAAVILCLLFLEELYRYVFCKNSSRLFIRLFDTKGHAPEYYLVREAGKQKVLKAPHTCYTLRSCRGKTLRGFYYPCGSQGKTIAFVVHGHRSEHADTTGICFDYYQSRGIDIFTCDHTGQGESGGHFIGFDVLEAKDCLLWLDFLIQTFGEDTQILLHGFSMGAATVLQMSSHCPPQVRFLVEDSGFENAYAAMKHQVGPLYAPLRLFNLLIARYDWNDSDVKESLLACRLPILFVHGQEDTLVPYENGPRLYQLYPGEKDCFFPENTKHIEAMYTCPEAYAQKLDCFLRQYLRPDPARQSGQPEGEACL